MATFGSRFGWNRRLYRVDTPLKRCSTPVLTTSLTVYIALLRAVNVGGTGKLPMAELKAMCSALGFSQVQTYIASGNVVFQSALSEAKVKADLEAKLQAYAGKPVGVHIRTAPQMQAVRDGNSFPDAAPNRVMAIFLDAPADKSMLTGISGQKDEQISLGLNELYVHYGEGMAQSKLKIPAAKTGTARNMNTVAKLVEMALAI
jgi:uncharacterized protein (DUF1697 family)